MTANKARHRNSAKRNFSATQNFERKVCSEAAVARMVRRVQRQGQRVVLTNGCFDVLHVGHVTLLQRAKRVGDVLVVAINSDRSVRALKGPGRPVVPQQDRARVLAALASVDAVVIFDDLTPQRLIAALKPDVLVKGADWPSGQIVGGDVVERSGGRVVRLPFIGGYSTTKLLTRIVNLAKRVGKALDDAPP